MHSVSYWLGFAAKYHFIMNKLCYLIWVTSLILGHMWQSIFLVASNAAAILPSFWALRQKVIFLCASCWHNNFSYQSIIFNCSICILELIYTNCPLKITSDGYLFLTKRSSLICNLKSTVHQLVVIIVLLISDYLRCIV